MDSQAVNWGDVAKDATWGAVFGPLGKKIGKLIPDGAGWYKLSSDLKKDRIIKEVKPCPHRNTLLSYYICHSVYVSLPNVKLPYSRKCLWRLYLFFAICSGK